MTEHCCNLLTLLIASAFSPILSILNSSRSVSWASLSGARPTKNSPPQQRRHWLEYERDGQAYVPVDESRRHFFPGRKIGTLPKGECVYEIELIPCFCPYAFVDIEELDAGSLTPLPDRKVATDATKCYKTSNIIMFENRNPHGLRDKNWGFLQKE